METRVLTSLDIPQLAVLIAESEAEGFRFLARLRRDDSVDTAYLESGHFVVLGNFDGERLIATGGLTPDPYLADPAIGRVRHVYVTSAYRRRGVGRQLMAALDQHAILGTGCSDFAPIRLALPLSTRRSDIDSATHARALIAGISAGPTRDHLAGHTADARADSRGQSAGIRAVG
jgi:GNAT superfamily N-acetyltransferase